jgi:hypothetical protein
LMLENNPAGAAVAAGGEKKLGRPTLARTLTTFRSREDFVDTISSGIKVTKVRRQVHV